MNFCSDVSRQGAPRLTSRTRVSCWAIRYSVRAKNQQHRQTKEGVLILYKKTVKYLGETRLLFIKINNFLVYSYHCLFRVDTWAIPKGIEEPIFQVSIGVLREIPISIIWSNWYRYSPVLTHWINVFKESVLIHQSAKFSFYDPTSKAFYKNSLGFFNVWTTRSADCGRGKCDHWLQFGSIRRGLLTLYSPAKLFCSKT